MPASPPRLIEEGGAEFEAAIQKRLREQAEALKLAGIDKQVASFTRELRMVKKRLDSSNHLKEQMVTKEDFQAWTTKQETLLTNFITVDRFEDGDMWVRAGVPHGMGEEEQAALKILATASAAKTVLDQAADRHHQRTSLRIGIFTAIIGAVTGATFAIITALGFLVPRIPHK